MIQFFNTLSGELEGFKPLKAGEVSLYTCGPTVYDYAHIGNFRTFVFEDLLRRFLEFKGYKVKHVMNITDVDDKTIAGANREQLPLEQFTAKYTQAFNEDLKTLNILPPAIQPGATHEIKAMLDLIQKLVDKKAAYEAEGSVYYRVEAFKNYGKLSKKDLTQNIKGARINVDEYDKEEGADFALWKKAKEGEPAWDSPWGKGRPGWHIECSAMSMKYLGETFDIHAGGEDLIFPHHENEIAQSEGATGKPFVKYWLHSKHLLVDGRKMSKKDKNFYTLRDLLEKGYDPMAIRFSLLSVHYRKQLNFTLESLKEAQEVIKRWDDCYWMCFSRLNLGDVPQSMSQELLAEVGDLFQHAYEEIDKSMSEDLNVSEALASINHYLTEINKTAGKMNALHLNLCLKLFQKMDALLGFDVSAVQSISEDVRSMLSEYMDLRKRKDFKAADELRAKIQNAGWLIKDGRPGELSTIKKKRRAWDLK